MSDRYEEPVQGGAHQHEARREMRDSAFMGMPSYETGRVQFWCPRCGKDSPPLEYIGHGEETECARCGIGVVLRGNGLWVFQG